MALWCLIEFVWCLDSGLQKDFRGLDSGFIVVFSFFCIFHGFSVFFAWSCTVAVWQCGLLLSWAIQVVLRWAFEFLQRNALWILTAHCLFRHPQNQILHLPTTFTLYLSGFFNWSLCKSWWLSLRRKWTSVPNPKQFLYCYPSTLAKMICLDRHGIRNIPHELENWCEPNITLGSYGSNWICMAQKHHKNISISTSHTAQQAILKNMANGEISWNTWKATLNSQRTQSQNPLTTSSPGKQPHKPHEWSHPHSPPG